MKYCHWRSYIRCPRAFVELGVNKIRLTGGEPLVRKGILGLIEQLGQLPAELLITTNGSQLPVMANDLKRLGVDRLNISWIVYRLTNLSV